MGKIEFLNAKLSTNLMAKNIGLHVYFDGKNRILERETIEQT